MTFLSKVSINWRDIMAYQEIDVQVVKVDLFNRYLVIKQKILRMERSFIKLLNYVWI